MTQALKDSQIGVFDAIKELAGLQNDTYREQQKEHIVSNLEGAKLQGIDFDRMQADGVDLTSNASTLVDIAKTLPAYKNIDFDGMDKDKVPVEYQLQAVQQNSTQLTAYNAQIQKTQERVRYDAPTSSGDTKLDDFVLGMRKFKAGVVRTAQDVGHIAGLLDDKTYASLDQDTKKHLDVIDASIKDNSLFSMATAGNLVASLPVGGVAAKGMGASWAMLRGIPVREVGKLTTAFLLSLDNAALSYMTDRGEHDSTTDSATEAAQMGGALSLGLSGAAAVAPGVVKGAGSIVNVIKSFFGTDGKEALTQYMHKFDLSPTQVGKLVAQADDALLFPEGTKFEDKALWIVLNATREGRAELKQLISRSAESDDIMTNYTKFRNATKELLNNSNVTMLKGRGLYKNEAIQDILDIVKKANDDVTDGYAAMYSKFEQDTRVVLTNAEALERAENMRKLEEAKAEHITISNDETELILQAEATKIQKDEALRQVRRDGLDRTEAQREYDEAKITLDTERNTYRETARKRKKVIADLQQEIAKSTSKYKLDEAEAPFEEDLMSSMRLVKRLLEQPEVTVPEAIDAVQRLNPLIERAKGTLKHTLSEVKKHFNNGLENALTTKEWQQWQELNSFYRHMSKFRETAIGQRITTLLEEDNVDVSRIDKFAKDLPQLLGTSSDKLYANLEKYLSKGQAQAFDRAIYGTLLNYDDMTVFTSLALATRSIRPASNVGRTVEKVERKIRRIIGNLDEFNSMMVELQDNGMHSSILNAILAKVIVRNVWQQFHKLTAKGRAAVHANKLLASDIPKLNKINNWLDTVDRGTIQKYVLEATETLKQTMPRDISKYVAPLQSATGNIAITQGGNR